MFLTLSLTAEDYHSFTENIEPINKLIKELGLSTSF